MITMHHLTHRTLHRQKKHELGFESLPHPQSFSDLAPSEYYLFPNLKRWLCARRFELNEEDERDFGGFDKPYYLEGIENKFLFILSRQYQTL